MQINPSNNMLIDLIKNGAEPLNINQVTPTEILDAAPFSLSPSIDKTETDLPANKTSTNSEIRILIIAEQNDGDSNRIAGLLVADEGLEYRVICTDDCTDAREIVKSGEAGLIIADWGVLASHVYDHGLDPETVLSAHNIPLLILTDDVALYNKVITNPLESDGMIDCIRKPINANELNTRVRLLIGIAHRIREAKMESEAIRKALNLRHQELHLELIIHSESVKEKILESVKSLDTYLNNEGRSKLRHMVRQFRWTIKDESDLDVVRVYDEMNSWLYKQLEKICPRITKSEKRLCAFTLKDHSGTDIAKMIGKSQNSINVAFARLRAKLGIPSNKELKKFLSEIGAGIEAPQV
ncbi:MAG TPA: hypothetical protein VL728_17955 [Cyclobacteriaceae bacterium]|nr:hypothetical protein [Cyclobacteriaceae bacterium]